MKPVRKAIIPAAGLGLWFLPATKAQPKEMLPIVEMPNYPVRSGRSGGVRDRGHYYSHRAGEAGY